MTAEEKPGRTDLSDLMRARMKEKKLGVRTLADACIDPRTPGADPLWKRGTISNLLNGVKIKFPDIAHIRALAAGLDLPESVVDRAARAQLLGEVTEHWNAGHDTRVLIARADELDEEDIKEVAEVAEDVLRRQTQRSSGQG